MQQLFANPVVRLAARALVAGLIAVATSVQHTGSSTLAWHAAAVAGGLAFCEVFTPLNALVGLGKHKHRKGKK